MKYSVFSLIGVLFFISGSASANEVTLAALFDGNRQALEHDCAEAKARFAPGDAEITTKCSPGNR